MICEMGRFKGEKHGRREVGREDVEQGKLRGKKKEEKEVRMEDEDDQKDGP